MPDGSTFPDIAEAPPRISRSSRQRCAYPTVNITPLVGNPTGLLFRLAQVEAELGAMDHDPETGGRWSYKGRALHRQAAALVNLAIELPPVNMADCVALVAAAYEKIGDVYREEREAKDITELLEAPINALGWVAKFLAPEIGLSVEDFGGDYICLGDAI